MSSAAVAATDSNNQSGVMLPVREGSERRDTRPLSDTADFERLDDTADQEFARHAGSSESVRTLVQEEGRAARNLLVFNVLVDNKSPSSVLRSPRRQPAASPVGASPRPGRAPRVDERRSPRPSLAHARKRGRARSVSAGRGSAKDLHARYWSFLFENLRRAVDEIYQTCETDDSVLECKETIMILERCTQDFRNLIEWLKIKWEYDHTPKPQRPASVAWEIRKTSPGKLPLQLVDKKLLGDQQSRKQLAFEERSTADAATSTVEAPATDPDGAVGRYLERALSAATAATAAAGVVETAEPGRVQKSGADTTGQERVQKTGSDSTVQERVQKSGADPVVQERVQKPSTDAAVQDRVQKSGTDPAVSQRAAAEGDGVQKSASAEAESGLRPAARARPAVGTRPRGARAPAPAAARPQAAVSPRGGAAGRAAPGRGGPTSVVPARGVRPELRPAGRQPQSAVGRGSVVTPRPERPQPVSATTTSAAGVRRPAGGEPRARGPTHAQRGPPPVRSTGSGTVRAAGSHRPGTAPVHPARAPMQRAATVCSGRPPAPAQAYSSCVKSHSNSSLSSTASSSGHSWADRVRGIPALPAGVPASVAAPPPALAASVDALVKAPESVDDDGGGWETVKGRSRSRLSSLGRAPDRAPLQRKGSAEAACVVRPHSARARFHQPTSAISLPSLSRIAADDESEEERRSEAAPDRRLSRGGARRSGGRPGGPARRTSAAPATPPVTRHQASEALRRSSEKVPAEPVPVTSAPRERRDRPPGQKSAVKTASTDLKHSKQPTEEKHGDSGRRQATSTGQKLGTKQTVEPSSECKQSKSETGDRREGEKSAVKPELPAQVSSPTPAAAVNDRPLPPGGDASPAVPVEARACPSDTTIVPEPDQDFDSKAEEASSTTDQTKSALSSGALFVDAAAEPAAGDAAHISPEMAEVVPSSASQEWTSPPSAHDPTSPATSRDLTSPPTSRDLTSPEMDDDSVDEEMVIAERALQSAIVEEQNLELQLAETEKCVIEVDTETDGDSTSVDTECEGDGEEEPGPLVQTIEEQYAPELESLSWGDRMDLLEELEELSSRAPGRGLQMHEKLSSPSRKKTLSETIRRHHERQQKASRKRQTLIDQKTQKLRDISIKISEVRQHKEQLLERRRLVLERKMERAEVKRRQHLQEVVRRAHDEEEKAKEIAFINEMEAKNKRHEFLSQIQTQELRLAGIQEERQRRVEEKAAKEAAVEEKRRALQAERRAKLEELKLKRQERLERIHREQEEKEKERQEMAREKQRDREERISALHAAQQATAEELQKRIQQKQEESARRHEENIGQIRQRALELSVRSAAAGSDDTGAQLAPYVTKKMCTLCSVLIGSEVYLLSHLRGRPHQEAVRKAAGADLSGEELLLYNLRHITDATPYHILSWSVDKDRHKALKKRCKKIKARMTARQEEFARRPQPKLAPVEAPHRAKLAKCVKELNKVWQGQGRGPWPAAAVSALDRTLGEVTRLLEKGVVTDRTSLCASGGLTVLSGIIGLIQDELARDVEIVPARTVGNVSRALAAACRDHQANSEHLVDSNMLAPAVDLLMTRLTRLSSACAASGGIRCDPGAAPLMLLVSTVLSSLTRPELSHQRWSVLQDVVSYLVCVGTVDIVTSFFSCVPGTPDSDPQLSHFLVQSLRLLRAMVTLLATRYPVCTHRKDAVDRTGLIATLQVTQLAGVVSMLYSVLLRQPPPSPPEAATPTLAAEALSLLLQTARLDLHMFQTCLGFEERSVEFRHVTSCLLRYCALHPNPELLKLVIQTTGYFAVRCYDNQMVIQKGTVPTVLQQLLTLPFAHFSEPALTAVLFPTLLACCYDNAQTRAILQQDLSFQILEDFLKTEAARSCHLVRVLLAQDEEGGSARSDTASVRSSVSIASS